MQKNIQISLLQYLIRHRNGYLTLACGSLVLNLVLGIALISAIGYEKVVIVPPHIEKTFWVRGGSVAPEYLSEMSLFFMNLRFNLTADNISSQRDVLLRYIDPQYYETLKMELVNEEEHMKKEHITTAFLPVEVKVDAKHLIAIVTGDLLSTVGTNSLPSKRLSYQINYRYGNAKLLVKSFVEVKIHD